MFLYETHMHTSPVSHCARVSVEDALKYYKSAGYAGVFMTEHFLDGNINVEVRQLPYEERINYYFSAYEEGKIIGEKIGLPVFLGIEMTYAGIDFLVYGIDKEWCLAHPDMDKLHKRDLLSMMREDGALLIQAHPFRDVKNEITLYPKHVHGVEIYNASRNEFENRLAAQYCENYGLIAFAGSDNHAAGARCVFGGMATERPIKDVADFKELTLAGLAKPFVKDENGVRLIG